MNGALRWNVGNGKQVRFWNDSWLRSGTVLKDVLIDHISPAMEVSTVNGMINSMGEWDVHKLKDIIPDWAVKEVCGNVPPDPNFEDDRVSWALNDNGRFSTKTAYHLAANSRNGPFHKVSSILWKCKVPQRLKCFVWMVLKGGLKTKSFCFSRKLTNDDRCPICLVNLEDTLHVLRDCPQAFEVWERFRTADFCPNFYSEDMLEWISHNLSIHICFQGVPWPTIFMVSISSLWYHRNSKTFSGKDVRVDELFQTIVARAQEYSNSLGD
ncbi:Reverse transcriptase zinc-binding domain [Sesbania bispinosa]|nr:Reverse transcriptase zinc-binding domain [Sesbania bispinosa]